MPLSGPRGPGREGSGYSSVLGAIVTLLAVALAVAAALVPRAPDREPRRGEGAHLDLGRGPDISGFARVTEPRPFTLPRDHGPHFDYQTEWWYFTGNLADRDGRRFGFQLTFFRRGLTPGPPPEGTGLSSNQVYFAHLAITDVAAARHVAAERFSRGAGGLAGATGEPFGVWLENWRAESLNRDGSEVRLVARDEESGLSLDLELAATKPLVPHGDRGVSPKSQEPGNASYYVGYTRLAARGRLGLGDEAAVAGEAWFDHEWSTSALGPGAVGWDWFSLQLDDGRELMLFQIRREDGSVESISGGTLVERDGRTRRLLRHESSIDALDHWTSAETGGRYPSRWRVRVPSAGLDLMVEPWIEGQEMRTSFIYWEGAVRVSGSSSRGPLSGQGYVELTGYAGSMQGVF